MKMKMGKIFRTLLPLVLVLLLAQALVGCGAPQPQELLAGQWQADVGSLEFQALTFTPNAEDLLRGSVSLGLLSRFVQGSYVVTPPAKKDQPARLAITYQLAFISTTRDYTFTVTDTTLELQKEGSNVALHYTRVATGASEPQT
jgi:hypothetical protein